jgi:hypothetical protein
MNLWKQKKWLNDLKLQKKKGRFPIKLASIFNNDQCSSVFQVCPFLFLLFTCTTTKKKSRERLLRHCSQCVECIRQTITFECLSHSRERVVFSLMNKNLSHKYKWWQLSRQTRWVFKREHVSPYRSNHATVTTRIIIKNRNGKLQ